MDGSGLTTFALVFMLLSMGSVTALTVYCFWRILAEPGSAGGATAAGPSSGDPTGGATAAGPSSGEPTGGAGPGGS